MTEYFEDMWLALESEMSSYDSFSPNEHSESASTPEGTGDTPEGNIEPQTYENLLEQRNAPNPTQDKLRSSDRSERINAVKELYNKVPTILNANITTQRIEKVAKGLYQLGLVKEGNELVERIEKRSIHYRSLYQESMCYGINRQAAKALRAIFADVTPGHDLHNVGIAWKRLTEELKNPDSDLEVCQQLLEEINSIDPNDLRKDIGDLYEEGVISTLEARLLMFRKIRDSIQGLTQPHEWDQLLIEYPKNIIDVRAGMFEFILKKAKDWASRNPEDLSVIAISSQIPELREYAEEKLKNNTEAGDSVHRLLRVAKSLAQQGLVKQSNELEEFVAKHFSYSQEETAIDNQLQRDINGNDLSEILKNL